MRCKIALSIALTIACCSIASAAVKFTIVRMVAEPAGPVAPGSEFDVVVEVRNDGDAIPADAGGFRFVFLSSDAESIGQPTGTPARFFGYCPGSTNRNWVCQCFGTWATGETSTMRARVKVGTTARGTVTVFYTVSRGQVSTTQSVSVQIAGPRGPDLQPKVTLVAVQLEVELLPQGGIARTSTKERAMVAGDDVKRGEGLMVRVDVLNVGDITNEQSFQVDLNSLGMSKANAWPGCGPDFPTGLVTHSAKIPPGGKITLCQVLLPWVEGVLAVKLSAMTSSPEDKNPTNDESFSDYFGVEAARDAHPFSTRPLPVILQTAGRR